jgi:chemotaxis regulatin CheY-phosphate phosphatase CheZ
MPGSPTLRDKIEVEMKDLAVSINGIVEAFRKMQNPLSESRENVPKATQQLDKITEQTEMATHRMLDVIEQLTSRQQEVIDGLKQVKTMISTGGAEVNSLVDRLIEQSDKSYNDAYTIMDALQFQDITSQQINHAASLLEDIGGKLHQIIAVMHGQSGTASANWTANDAKGRVFDPHADMVDKITKQEDIDSLFDKNQKAGRK